MCEGALTKVDLARTFEAIEKCWEPKIAARINDCYLKLVKFEGEFLWHHHESEDELFLVVKGELRMDLKGQEAVHLREGQFLCVPHGIEHRPVVEQGRAQVVMVEPVTTVNTGSTGGERTVEAQWLRT